EDLMAGMPEDARRIHSHLGEPPRPGLRDWRREMPSNDVAVFEAVAGTSLERFGYPRDNARLGYRRHCLALFRRGRRALQRGRARAGSRSRDAVCRASTPSRPAGGRVTAQRIVPSPATQGATAVTLPTFLVVGAMKGGTTALHTYLGSHPQVFMSDPKEPHF